MQNYIKPDTDTRTFQQIWNSLTSAEQSSLRGDIREKLGFSRQTVYDWHKNGASPKSLALRKVVCRIVNKNLGLKTHYLTLFPNAK